MMDDNILDFFEYARGRMQPEKFMEKENK